MYRKIRLWIAVKIKWLRPHLLTKTESENLTILEIRSSFRFLGFDTSEMSDDDIKKGIEKIGKVVVKVGLSKDEAIEVSNRMATHTLRY